MGSNFIFSHKSFNLLLFSLGVQNFTLLKLLLCVLIEFKLLFAIKSDWMLFIIKISIIVIGVLNLSIYFLFRRGHFLPYGFLLCSLLQQRSVIFLNLLNVYAVKLLLNSIWQILSFLLSRLTEVMLIYFGIKFLIGCAC